MLSTPSGILFEIICIYKSLVPQSLLKQLQHGVTMGKLLCQCGMAGRRKVCRERLWWRHSFGWGNNISGIAWFGLSCRASGYETISLKFVFPSSLSSTWTDVATACLSQQAFVSLSLCFVGAELLLESACFLVGTFFAPFVLVIWGIFFLFVIVSFYPHPLQNSQP